MKLAELKKSLQEELKRASSDTLDFQLWSDDEVLDNAALKLFKEYQENTARQRALSETKYIPVIKVLILNLIKAARIDSYVGYGRSKRFYKSNRYNPIGIKFDTFCGLIDWLEHKYLKNSISSKSRRKNAKSSRVKAKDLFWKQFGIDPRDRIKRSVHPEAQYVVLREAKDIDQKKPLKEYVETPKTAKMNKFLRLYNELIHSTTIKCADEEHEDLRIVRIFNGDFEHGGRFYGGLEGVKRELRRTITIDGQATVEVDYKCLHPSMLYASLGIQLDFDAYKIEGALKYRPLVKVILNCILDCAPNRVLSAVKTAIHEEKRKKEPLPEPKDLRQLIGKTRELNSPIKRYFSSRCSLELQFKDSQIAESVLKVFVERKMPILCVHDSFIVRKQDEDLLIQTMHDAYSSHNNGFKISVEPK